MAGERGGTVIPMRQCYKGKNSPLTLVIGPHHHPEIFDRDH